MMRCVVIAAATLASGCATAPALAPSAKTLPAGQWGGDQIALEIAEDGSGKVELSCASAGFAGPVKLDVGGHFLTKGWFARGTGVEKMDPPAPLPANISGRLDRGGTLWLDIALADAYPVRGARLERGAEPRLMRCL